ncbi:hypothetical protein C8F04DRAFT_1267190 [Mycena alexandri]|uniref:Uncharacterized protein n=1 Tax=Mycena alexandri TaxID=1745969 RepID=A0AAD6X008_9AGAR|nr:hypothetical protein C8F04DRAFT_1267190 [Mycena alexandri]
MPANLCRDVVLDIPPWKYADLFLGERYFNWGFQLRRVGTDDTRMDSGYDEDLDEVPDLVEQTY